MHPTSILEEGSRNTLPLRALIRLTFRPAFQYRFSHCVVIRQQPCAVDVRGITFSADSHDTTLSKFGIVVLPTKSAVY